jgi:chromosome segregation ATPase
VAELVRDQEARLSELSETVARLESDKALAEEELTGLKGEAAGLKARTEGAEADLAAARDDALALGQERQTLKKRAADLQARLAKAEEAAASMPAIHGLQDRIAQLEAALADSQAAVQEMLADKPRISQVLDKWKAAQASTGPGGAEAETARLQARVQELERSRAGARRPAEKAAGRGDDAPQAAAGEPVNKDLQLRVAELDAFIGKVQAEMKHLREENRQLAGHVAELEAERTRKK